MRRIAIAGLAVTLLMIGGVTAGCASLPAATSSSSPAPSLTDDASGAYDVRLGPIVAGNDGKVSIEVYVPVRLAPGIWVRVSALDGTFTKDVCQVVVEDTTTSTSDGCSVEVLERDKHGNLQGVVLHVDGLLNETGYFEVDSRDLMRTDDGGWHGETSARSVDVLGFLSPKSEWNK